MADPLVIARAGERDIALLPGLANRHGLVAGATGTGKTITLQAMTQKFSSIGVPVFVADVKGDLSGLAAAGTMSPKLEERLKGMGIDPAGFRLEACPVVFWDVFGERGHPVRATISEMGPLLLGRLLGLNDVQQGVLTLAFKIADDQQLLLLDLKDLRAMLQYVSENAKSFQSTYGNVSAASIGAIQRGLLEVEQQGGEKFFGEPALDIADLMQTDRGRGVVNVLAAEKLMNSPKLYSTFLLYLLSELFENLPEVGDLEKPKLVFFFDEAHLLFNDAPKPLLEKIEQVVRLIRSKGVGVYFVTQNPLDVPDTVLAQLGNRVQHALRAFTPKDQKAVKTAAETMRPNPKVNAEAAITEMAVGEALISFLDAKGTPTPVERAFVIAPGSKFGPIDDAARAKIIAGSVVAGHYEKQIDRESAYEKLQAKQPGGVTAGGGATPGGAPAGGAGGGIMDSIGEILLGKTGPRGGHKDGILTSAAKSAARSMATQAGREIMRGVLGSLLGKRR
jgi:DNA helicase HerA-like ATPase